MQKATSQQQQHLLQKLSGMMLPIKVPVPPCSRFAPPCYQASASWQQWSRPQQHPKPYASDDDEVRPVLLRLSIVAPPPGLGDMGPDKFRLDAANAPIKPPAPSSPNYANPSQELVPPRGLGDIGTKDSLLNAPSVPMKPPPLPSPRYLTPSQQLVEAVFSGSELFLPKFIVPLKSDLEEDLATTDSESGDSLYPHRLFDGGSSEEAATSASKQLPEEEESANLLLSKGSLKHDQRKCMPCHFFRRKQGCVNGVKCRFCHLHGEMRNRPDKRRREKARQEVDEWEQMECDPQTKGKIAAKLASKDAYFKMLIERKLKDMEVQTSF